MTVINTNTIARPVSEPVQGTPVPVKISFAANWRARLILFRALGAFLVMSAFAMWVLPGSAFSTEVLPIKAGASLLYLVFGVVLLTLEFVGERPDAYFDPIRREVRVLQKNENGRPQTVLRRSYDTLGSARFSDRQVELYDMDGSLLMKLPLPSPEVSHALKGQLSGSVPISH